MTVSRKTGAHRLLRRVVELAAGGGLVMLAGLSGGAQTLSDGGQITRPSSDIEHPGDVGTRAHTNVEVLTPDGGAGPMPPRGKAPPGAANPPPAKTPDGRQGSKARESLPDTDFVSAGN